MKPDIWGNHAWNLLNCIVLEYENAPTQIDKDNMTNFFMALGKVLPCKKCQVNYSSHLLKYPLDNTALSSKSSLIKWLINIHNEVNISTGKKVLTHEEGLKCMLEKCEEQSTLNWYFTVILTVLFVIFLSYGIYLLWKKYYGY